MRSFTTVATRLPVSSFIVPRRVMFVPLIATRSAASTGHG